MDRIINCGDKVEDFSLNDLKGRAHRISSYQGKLVIINFWSAECPWAKRFDETVLPMVEKWGGEVALLQIASNANESFDEIKQVSGDRGPDLILLDSDQVIANIFGAVTTPHVYVIDREGILRYRGAVPEFAKSSISPK